MKTVYTTYKVIAIIMLFAFSTNIYAKGDNNVTRTIKGKIIDTDTRLGIDYANVVVLGANLWSITDENGYFLIEGVTPGIYKLECSKLGLRQQLHQIIL